MKRGRRKASLTLCCTGTVAALLCALPMSSSVDIPSHPHTVNDSFFTNLAPDPVSDMAAAQGLSVTVRYNVYQLSPICLVFCRLFMSSCPKTPK